LKKALAIQPANLDARLDLIRLQAAQKRTAEAERELDRLATEMPADARVRYARAAFYASLARTREAISEFKTVLAIAPESPGVKLEMAVVYVQARDYYSAVSMLEDYHRTMITADSSYLMGHALAELGRIDEAERWLVKAVEGREGLFGARLDLGRLYFTKRKYEEAIKHLSRAVELTNESVEARYLLGF
jgi:Flp pilus assembly protein TadD